MATFLRISNLALLAAALLTVAAAAQAPRVGAPAPAFTATDSHGQSEALD